MIERPLYQNPLAGGQKSSFNLLQRPDQNIEKQYFYNKELNKLFNMPGGVRMAAPKGFESVTKNQYEDFASKGATLQGASMFNDAFGGGYNLDLPRLTSGPNSGQVDRNSPEFLYYYGDQQKTILPPVSLGPTMPTQEEGISGASGSNVPLNNFPGNPNRKPLDLFAGRPVLTGDEERVQAPPLLDGTKGFPVTVSGPETIASVNPFEEQFTGFQNQLTSFGDQFSTLGDRLTKLEEGIASLLNRNMSSNFNSMQPAFGHSRYGYSPFSMVGLGSLFGGYYG